MHCWLLSAVPTVMSHWIADCVAHIEQPRMLSALLQGRLCPHAGWWQLNPMQCPPPPQLYVGSWQALHFLLTENICGGHWNCDSCQVPGVISSTWSPPCCGGVTVQLCWGLFALSFPCVVFCAGSWPLFLPD